MFANNFDCSDESLKEYRKYKNSFIMLKNLSCTEKFSLIAFLDLSFILKRIKLTLYKLVAKTQLLSIKVLHLTHVYIYF